ncbi:27 kDa hemolymph protein-like [Topomyia yanbarensis]|uniref:27 kDa hemolymph protein-like n=1 Tax=Topomyia yanbarensis TaxID=2498891 RepID=UPI00273C655F|nr:27 kDa hemolymph protein-like [Topomyia yanbarensis]
MKSRVQIVLSLLAALVAASIAGRIPPTEKDNSSSEESGETNEALNEIRAACQKNTGSNETFDQILSDIGLVPLCAVEKLDVDGFTTDLDSLSNATRKQFFAKYCPQLEDSISCLNPALNKFRSCLEQEDTEIIDILFNLLPEAVRFICRNDGEIFFMNDRNFYQCFDKAGDYASECIDKISNSTEAMDLSHYGAKQCGELADVRECFQSKLDECQAPRLIDVFDLFYRPLMKSSPCKRFIVFDEMPVIESNDI